VGDEAIMLDYRGNNYHIISSLLGERKEVRGKPDINES
jgi:hypothetical protein